MSSHLVASECGTYYFVAAKHYSMKSFGNIIVIVSSHLVPSGDDGVKS